MATKPAFPFGGKETKGKEAAEKKKSPAAYKRGEKAEGEKPGKKAMPPWMGKK